GKPVRARRVGVGERVVKWARRRPAAALLVAALLVGSVATAGTVAWLRQQADDRRAAKEKREEQAREAIDNALKRAAGFRREERWKEALQVVTAALPHLAEANSPELDHQLRRAHEDFRIADELERARESNPLTVDGDIDYPQRVADYQQTFANVGL